jgi:hypothetical protein
VHSRGSALIKAFLTFQSHLRQRVKPKMSFEPHTQRPNKALQAMSPALRAGAAPERGR